tara:strand:- start:18 stop:791 length:774 start_codon:yes stop_codon:yes gene_type:complete
MKNLLIILTMLLQPNKVGEYTEKTQYQDMVHQSSARGVKNAVYSSLMIQVIDKEGRHSMGTGNLIQIDMGTQIDFAGDSIDITFREATIILTAQHVVANSDMLMVVERNGNIIPATVIYEDETKDIAAVVLQGQPTITEAIDFKQKKDNKIGKEVYHCGHPSIVPFNLSRGIITSLQENHVVTDSFALPGSSGSVVFGKGGDIIGIVVSVGFDQPFGLPELIEEVVRVSLIDYLDIQGIVEALENGHTGTQSGDDNN